MRCLVVGHVTRDVIRKGSKVEERLGGGAYYSALALTRFCTVEILTSFSSLPEEWMGELKRVGKLRVVQSDSTTTYELTYTSPSERTLRLLERAGEIGSLPAEKYELIIINPVANEVPPHLVGEALKRGKLVAVDAQGFLRTFKNGEIELTELNASFLRGIGVLHAEKGELKQLRGFSPGDVESFLITDGPNPGIAHHRGRAYRFYPVKVEVEESTGAGDVFLASFSGFYLQCPFIQSLRRALAFTALFLERRSIDFPMEDVGRLSLEAKVEHIKG
ncbi:carbohydrate kinase [Thermococcus sp.]|uniref:carbohydrate kinase n=1 Tax=Thermococcus sp. TaxID=35749 RepID=UPI00263523BB|nr:carbohydrate kinase [Thermococcus sp.]